MVVTFNCISTYFFEIRNPNSVFGFFEQPPYIMYSMVLDRRNPGTIVSKSLKG